MTLLAFRTKKTRRVVEPGGLVYPTEYATSISQATTSTTEAHVRTGLGTASSVRAGVLLKVSIGTSPILADVSDIMVQMRIPLFLWQNVTPNKIGIAVQVTRIAIARQASSL